MKFGTGSTTELTQKREGQSTKCLTYVHTYIQSQTSPIFDCGYPCKVSLATRRALQLIVTSDVLDHKCSSEPKDYLFYLNDFDFSNTEATENKAVRFLNLAYRVKGISWP